MKKIIYFIIFINISVSIFVFAHTAWCQDMQNLLAQATELYKSEGMDPSGLIGGLSAANLIASLIFGFIGFLAFVYGKKRSEFMPMIFGIALMIYPYFLKNTIVIYLIGVLLTAGLYFFR